MKPDIEELRRKYIETPPEGMTSADIRHMSEEDLLDMDYISSKPTTVYLSCPPLCGLFSIQQNANGGLSYKVKKCLRHFNSPAPQS